MNWLARLKSGDATGVPATKPAKPPQGDERASSVGFVAYSPAPFQKIDASITDAAKSDPVGAGDKVTTRVADIPASLEVCNWPHDDAMTAAEIDKCIDRRARFLACGQTLEDAERLVNKLLIRDREGDDRRMCLECSYYGSSGRCVAAAIGRLVGASSSLEPVPTILQRCEAFGLRKGLY